MRHLQRRQFCFWHRLNLFETILNTILVFLLKAEIVNLSSNKSGNRGYGLIL